MLLIDPEDGFVLHASNGALEFYGYTLEELKKLRIQDINISTNNDVQEDMKKAQEEKCNEFMFRHRKSNGVIVPVRVLSEDIVVDDQHVLFSIIQDLPEHQRYMVEYMKVLQRYKAVFNQVGDMILLLHVDEDYHPLEIIEVNRCLVETLKYSENDLLNMSISEVLHSTAVDQFSQIGNELKQNGETSFYLEAIDRVGKKIPIYVNASVMEYADQVVIVASGKNLSFEFDLQLDLDTQEDYYRTLFSKSPNNIFLINEGHIVCDYNAAVVEYFKLDTHGMLGNSLSSALKPLHIDEHKLLNIIEEAWLNNRSKDIILAKGYFGEPLVLEVIVIPFSLPDHSMKAYVLLNDITEFTEKSNQTEVLSAVFSNNNEGVLVMDADSKIEWVNHSFEKITGFKSFEALGKTPSILRSNHYDESFYKKIWYQVDREGSWSGEVWARRKNGFDQPLQLNVFVVEGKVRREKKYISIMSDLTKIKEQENRITELAYIDTLTGLKNRSYFMNEVTEEIKRSKVENRQFSVIYLDLDNFKVINDSMGHSFGDQVLIQFAECIDEMFTDIGVVGRIGGDEFAILLKEVSPEVLNYYFEELVEQLKRPFYIKDRAIRVLFSAGIAQFPIHGDTADILLKNADIAMYKAKSYSGMSYMYYSVQYSAHMARELYIENLVLSGIEREEFFMEYQPIVCRKTKAIVGLEALVRWHTRDNGIISPVELIPICEKNGTIKELGQWILERSIKDLIIMNAALKKSLFISINVSTVQLFDDALVKVLKHIIGMNIIEPGLIELEITETAYMQDFNRMKKVLKQLKELGVKIVIDDFGTGYSSFHQLINLEVDKLKIDQSFIRQIETSEKHLCLVDGILTMAENLNLDVVCEGIEFQQQLSRMSKSSWLYGQGYIFSKPIKMETFIEQFDDLTNDFSKLL
jgi:diguanylate cyclase (GGDEF)-like protein/PAS domain S-box-containing protein